MAFGAGDGWTVEISTSEVEKFSPVFQTISEMQGAAEALGIRVTQFAEKGDFAGRRVCDRQLDARAPVMPLHFCGGYKDECSLCDLLKGEWCPSSAAGWHHYGPDRRMVYFLNDSILALRPWLGVEPTRAELLQSMKGSMHPTARAHAVAAQNLNCRLDVRVCVSTAGAFDSAQED